MRSPISGRIRHTGEYPARAGRKTRCGRFLRLRAGILAVCMAALCLLSACGGAKKTALPPVMFASSLGDVRCAKSTQTQDGYRLESRVYLYEDGSTVSMARLTALEAQEARELARVTLPEGSGQICVYDEDRDVWSKKPLSEQTLGSGSYLIRGEKGDTYVVTPQCYLPHENGMIEWIPELDGELHVEKREDGNFDLVLTGPAQPADSQCEYLIVTADYELFKTNDISLLMEHGACQFTGSHRWCLDGYYYIAPTTYYPSGENYYYRNPAAYQSIIMMRDTQPISEILGLAMMDVLLGNQTAAGYIPMLAGSEWLRDSYGIGPGYYDTRWNSDFWTAVVNAVERYEVPEWLPAAKEYADFFVAYAEDHHFGYDAPETLPEDAEPEEGEAPAVRPQSDDPEAGWLVQDYASGDGKGRPTHASLNHHAAETVFLYRVAAASGRARFAEIADRMALGIANTADLWIREDGDLWYCCNPDGTFDQADYPVLTRDDLAELQRLYTELHGAAQPEIARLIESKEAWMSEHGY